MADRIEAKSMSYDDWKALGPLFHAHEPEGDNIYDGTTRERPTTPKWASSSLGGPKKLLGNPNHSSKNDAFTNAHSQWMHIGKLLDKGNDETLKFIRAAAKEGDKMSGISERMHGNADAWVALASDAQTASVLRSFIKSTLDHYPASKGVKGQQLPTKVEDLPLDALKASMDTYRPKRFRRRVLENGMVRHANPDKAERDADKAFAASVKSTSKAKPRQFSGTMAIFADDGMEKVAAQYAKTLDDRLLVCPEKNGALWKAMGEVRPQGVFYPRDYNHNLKQGQAGDQLINRSDAAVFFTNGDPASRVSGLLAQASRLGKAVKVIGPEGREEPLMAAALEAEATHMSKKEVAQSFSSHAFDMPASDPTAYLGLSMVKHDKLGTISDKDLSRIAEMTETVNEISDMATNQGGQEFLRDEMKITPATIRLLGDTDAMASARDHLLKDKAEMNRHDMELIGAQDYPMSLMRSGNVPAFMRIEGDKDFLRNAGTIVGISGTRSEDEREMRIAGSVGTKAVSALTMQAATVAYVQGQTSVDVPETGPQIMIAPVGAAHVSKEDREKQKRVVENGGVVIHMQAPENSSWYYDAKAKNPETGKKGATLPVPSQGEAHIDRRAADLLGALSDTVLVTAINAKETESHQHVAVLSGLRAGRMPTVVNFNEYEGVETISGNRALLNSTGERALSKAGFGNRDAEAIGPKFAGRKVAIDTGKNMDVAMTNLVRHLDGKEIQLPENAKSRQSRTDEAEL